MKNRKTIVSMCFYLLFALVGCKEKKTERHFPSGQLSEGDVAFRRGTGLASRAVLTVDMQGSYSHVGIVVNDSGNWKVVHSVPGESEFAKGPDKIKMESVSSFFRSNRAVAGAVMRVDADSSIRERAAKHAIQLYKRGVLFDHDYNKEDTTKLYCSELVQFVYLYLGLDLIEDKYSEIHIPGFSGLYILPSDIQCSKHIRLIESF